jgi:hypothetical protein
VGRQVRWRVGVARRIPIPLNGRYQFTYGRQISVGGIGVFAYRLGHACRDVLPYPCLIEGAAGSDNTIGFEAKTTPHEPII